MKRMSGAHAEMRKAVICAVTVVPMFAPKMTPAAWVRVMSPASAKSITITFVAEELWMSTVTAAPASTATKRLPVAFSRMRRSLSPQALRRPDDISVMP